MLSKSLSWSRRNVLKTGGVAGVAVAAGIQGGASAQSARPARGSPKSIIEQLVESTAIIDTHEHLIEEDLRLAGKHRLIKANDWSCLLSHYLNSDLTTCGMPRKELEAFFAPGTDPLRKWSLLEPYWQRVRHTGYGQAVEIAMMRLYDIERLSGDTVNKVQQGYERTLQPGIYKKVLQDMGRIESCQVNSLDTPFSESRQPLLLMQDLSFRGMHIGPDIESCAGKAGIAVKDLQDWHRVIDWWFRTYGPYAVAVKSQAAYSRNIDYEDVPAEQVQTVFKSRLNGDPIGNADRKRLEDHLFWYCVRKATEYELPVKIHTGYYAGSDSMPLSRVERNAAAASDLCKAAPDTRFVFMHIDYPYYEPMIALAKHYTNCYIDMCWAWIVSPVASVNFLKQFLVTAPANKVLTFGGDYIPVEPVLGHVVLARRGIARVLVDLVEEGWLNLESASSLAEPIMRGNARALFNLEHKARKLQAAPWISSNGVGPTQHIINQAL
ncbi:MAG: amidohydrolase family protein [Acidobacteria bacterium]|nr:amidohydrolase family protein [Acidobacteriota bacterium]